MNKPILYLFAFLLFAGTAAMFMGVRESATEPTISIPKFSSALWDNWGFSVVIVSVIIFCGGLGVLALLGSGWKW